jgi:hypothetical protein
VDAGYAVVLGTLGVYSLSLVRRDRAARRRIEPAPPRPQPEPAATAVEAAGEDPGAGR